MKESWMTQRSGNTDTDVAITLLFITNPAIRKFLIAGCEILIININCMDYSQTQASNIATIVGVLVFVLHYFNLNIGNDEVSLLVSGLFTVGGIIWNWYHRYSKGDITLAGFRK